jgi:acetolactate synthase-1/3 small subunit
MEPNRQKPTEKKQRTFSVLVENEPGVLSRIAGLFSARGYNIISLTVGETDDPSVSRMTIVAEGTEPVLEQINKQLNKLIPVISVKNLLDGEFVSRELLLAKIDKTDASRRYLKDHWTKHNWMIIDESPEHFIVQAVGSTEEIQGIIGELAPFHICEISRTGRVALSKKYKIGVTEKKPAKAPKVSQEK